MLITKDRNYYINNPIFVQYKTKFDLLKWARVRYLKSAYVNERIIEIPYALSSLNQLPKDKKILDLGCTESVLPLNAACLGYRVVGFDFRKYPYVHPNLHITRGDVLKLPFKDESFGLVFCISTLEHLGIGFYHDPQLGDAADVKATEEVQRVLEKNGIVIITVPFGIPQVNDQQRVYNDQSLEKITNKFKVSELKFFVNYFTKDNGTNYWQEVGRSEASQVTSKTFTKCVCLAKLIKR